MTTLDKLLGNSGAAALGGWSMPIFSSKSITFTQTGTVVLSVVGAGGGGGSFFTTAGAATGGNSAPWGRKKIKVSAGDVLALSIAAGGARATTSPGNGSPGGDTTVTLNGVTIMTVRGGEGGVGLSSGTANAPTASATVTGADYWVSGLRAGSATSGGAGTSSGGAAVDVLSCGLGRSPDASGASGLGGSVGTNAGGYPTGWIALLDFGMVITDGATASPTVGATGRGAASNLAAGHFAGGFPTAGGAIPSMGGIGAGGAGSSNASAINAGVGGPGYAYLTFTPED